MATYYVCPKGEASSWFGDGSTLAKCFDGIESSLNGSDLLWPIFTVFIAAAVLWFVYRMALK
jgi:hypothetical protein